MSSELKSESSYVFYTRVATPFLFFDRFQCPGPLLSYPAWSFGSKPLNLSYALPTHCGDEEAQNRMRFKEEIIRVIEVACS